MHFCELFKTYGRDFPDTIPIPSYLCMHLLHTTEFYNPININTIAASCF
uniref:Uncharacterized protein n=1 Tax=Anguilla anguilla TaxID=7936 RepID=A0A0E9W183_ANGAN